MPTEGTAYLFTAYLKRDAKPEPQGIALSFDGQLPVPSTLNAQVFTLLFSLIIHPFSVFVNSKTRIFPNFFCVVNRYDPKSLKIIKIWLYTHQEVLERNQLQLSSIEYSRNADADNE